ncbi:MAG: phosphatase PAP2 family protein [Candidatus Tumulicola sp.]
MKPSLRAVMLAAALAMVMTPAGAKDTAIAPYYLAPGAVELTQLLAPPPNLDSPLEQYDEKKIAVVLGARTDADLARAAVDQNRSIFVFSDVLGNGFAAERLPLTAALFRHVGADTEALIERAKAYFARPRPAGARQTHGSYPSGHAAFASCAAILLGQMVPEKRGAIFARADIFAESRIVAGVHYPSDVEAGWISGTVIAAALMRDPRFLEDFSAAKAEVRRVLSLT